MCQFFHGCMLILHLCWRYQKFASPESVHSRSSQCDIDWPQYKSVSQQELDLPLAYVITAFSDPRNVELSLATIFRPHNSYCVHIDQKSSKQFRLRMIKKRVLYYQNGTDTILAILNFFDEKKNTTHFSSMSRLQLDIIKFKI